MGAGAVLYSTGKSKMSELGGLAGSLPWVLLLYMVGALSISAFPLFSGFVSKSLVVHAAELSRETIVVSILNLASVGTFLSIALKVPYLTWFAPDRSIETQPYSMEHVCGYDFSWSNQFGDRYLSRPALPGHAFSRNLPAL